MHVHRSMLAAALVWFLMGLSNIPAQAQDKSRQPLTELFDRAEVRLTIKQWGLAHEFLYKTLYDKPIAIEIQSRASDDLVNQYASRRLSAEFFENKDVGKFAIRRDIATILNRAFYETVKSKYTTLARFIADRQATVVTLTTEAVQASIAAEDCNIIPCPPDKCDPDCSRRSFDRFTK